MKLERLDQVVEEWGIGSDMSDPVGWMKRQIKAGRVRARRIGRHWYMTPDDIEAALAVFASAVREKPAVETPERSRRGPSAGSLKRRIA